MSRFFRNAPQVLLGAAVGVLATLAFVRWQSRTAVEPQPNIVQTDPTAKDSMSASFAEKSSAGIDTLNAAKASRAAGNYVLDLDIPYIARQLSDRNRKMISEIMGVKGPLYEKMFAEMNIDQPTRDQLLHHVALIFQAKLEARGVLTQLLYAQERYEGRLKELLGDRFDEYQRFEDAGKARQECINLGEFAKKSGLADLPSDRWSKIAGIVQAAGAYSARTLGDPCGGPFDEIPKPLRGNAVVQRQYEQSQATLAVNAAEAVKQAKEAGLTAQEMQLLENYYDSQLKYYERNISSISDPVGAEIRFLEEKIAEKRANPSSVREDMSSLERRLDMARGAAASNAGAPR